MDVKYSRVLKYCESQIDRTLKLFKKRKGNPPVPRNFPPLSGSILNVTILIVKFVKIRCQKKKNDILH